MLIAGCLPANSTIAQAASGRTASSAQTRLRSSLTVLQFAVTLALLGGASLMLLSLRSLLTEPTGLHTKQTLYFSPDLVNAKVPVERIPQIHSIILDQIRQHPGVKSAAWTMNVPLAGSLQMNSIELPNHPNLTPSQSMTAIHMVTDGYFDAMGIPLVAGNDFPSGKTNQPQACDRDRELRPAILQHPSGRAQLAHPYYKSRLAHHYRRRGRRQVHPHPRTRPANFIYQPLGQPQQPGPLPDSPFCRARRPNPPSRPLNV